MKPITFSKDSWHFKLMSNMNHLPDNYDRYDPAPSTDICAYSRKLFTCLLVVAIVVMIAVMAGPVTWGDCIAWLVACNVTGQWILPDGLGAGAIGEVVIAIAIGIAWCITTMYIKYKTWKRANKPKENVPDEPSIIYEIYRKFKDKTCVRINFK